MALLRHVPLLDMSLEDSIMGDPEEVLIADSDNYAHQVTGGPLGHYIDCIGTRINYPTLNTDRVYNEFSIAFWFMPKSYGDSSLTSTWKYLISIKSSGPNNTSEVLRFVNNQGNNYQLFGNNVFTNSSGFYNLAITSSRIPVNTWAHVIYAIKSDNSGTVCKLYINGNYIGQQTTTYKNGGIKNSRLTIGENHSAINFGISDLRIYDHILSEYEIKELLKRMILHYSFDVGGGHDT